MRSRFATPFSMLRKKLTDEERKARYEAAKRRYGIGG